MSDHPENLLTMEDLARLCAVEREWVARHVQEGLLIADAMEENFTTAALRRARRMRQLERDFDAVPELAALVADMLEEMDSMRALLRRRGLA